MRWMIVDEGEARRASNLIVLVESKTNEGNIKQKN